MCYKLTLSGLSSTLKSFFATVLQRELDELWKTLNLNVIWGVPAAIKRAGKVENSVLKAISGESAAASH